MSESAVYIDVLGERLVLHPDRAVLWPRRKTVIVADTHFGKSGFFSRHGIGVPVGSDDEDRMRLNRLLRAAEAETLLVLGDFLHAPVSLDSDDGVAIERWARDLDPVRVTVIAGNHDRGATPSSSIHWQKGSFLDAPFRFIHDADLAQAQDEYFTLSGHVHPVTVLGGMKRGLRVPVFWRRAAGLVLPSFGVFTGGYAVRAGIGERLYAVGPEAVTPMPTHG